MSILRHRVLLCLLALLLLVAPLVASAQGDTVRIDGSRIVADIVEPLSTAYADDNGVDVSLEISGTGSGLSRLCGGETDIATAARAITREEAQACTDNDVNWVEVPLGYDALAAISNPAITALNCVTISQMSGLFGPGATGAVNTLNQVNPAWEELSVTFYTPSTDNSTYNLLDSLLPGEGLRTDLDAQDPAAIPSMVADDVAGIGFAPLSAINASEAEVNVLPLDDLSGNGCVAAEQATLADGTYPAARGLYLYVNAASLETEAVQGLVSAMVSEDARAAVEDAGFVAIDAATADTAAATITDIVTGRQFSHGEPLYTIPLDISGTLALQSDALAYNTLNAVSGSLTATYAGVTATTSGFGAQAVNRDVCGGQAAAGAVAADGITCEETPVQSFTLGHQAVVLVTPAEAEYAACLTTEQVATLWSAEGGEAITNWNALGENFPDQDISIFLPRDNRSVTDYILTHAADTLINPRTDALENNNDPLYRAAAVANVEGAITAMSYAEFLDVDADVQAVAIDAGDGCVAPSLDTIRDSSYVLSNPVSLVVSDVALAQPEVQALVWYAVRDRSADVLADAGLLPVDSASFTAYQEAAVAAFAAAEEAASTPAVEPTAEPATEEPTAEASGN